MGKLSSELFFVVIISISLLKCYSYILLLAFKIKKAVWHTHTVTEIIFVLEIDYRQVVYIQR